MNQLIFRLCFCFIIAIALKLPPAGAAEFGYSNNKICDLNLSGEILTGDFEKFVTGFDISNTLRVCLNSPGGNLAEAILFMEAFGAFGISTAVAENGQCLSSCALIFLTGTNKVSGIEREDNDRRSGRKMHFTAKLGFHRPKLSAPDTLYNKSEINRAFDLAQEAMLKLLLIANRRSDGKNAAIPQDLFTHIIDSREDGDFFYIDTVAKAVAWDIGIFGFAEVENFSDLDAENACKNINLRHLGYNSGRIESFNWAGSDSYISMTILDPRPSPFNFSYEVVNYLEDVNNKLYTTSPVLIQGQWFLSFSKFVPSCHISWNKITHEILACSVIYDSKYQAATSDIFPCLKASDGGDKNGTAMKSVHPLFLLPPSAMLSDL